MTKVINYVVFTLLFIVALPIIYLGYYHFTALFDEELLVRDVKKHYKAERLKYLELINYSETLDYCNCERTHDKFCFFFNSELHERHLKQNTVSLYKHNYDIKLGGMLDNLSILMIASDDKTGDIFMRLKNDNFCFGNRFTIEISNYIYDTLYTKPLGDGLYVHYIRDVW